MHKPISAPRRYARGKTLFVLLALLAFWLCIPLSTVQTAESDDNGETGNTPSLETAIGKMLSRLSIRAGEKPHPPIIIPADANEVERFCAAMARFELNQATSCLPPSPPVTTSMPDHELPSRLDEETIWEIRDNREQGTRGLAMRVIKTENEHRILGAVYSARDGRQERKASTTYSLPDGLAFLRDAEPEEMPKDDREWMTLFRQLFPPCATDRDETRQSTLAQACHFFHRGLWQPAADTLGDLSGEPQSCLLYRVVALYLAGKPADATQIVEDAIRRRPDNGPLYALKTWLLHREEETNDALMILQQGRLSDVQREGLYHLMHHFIAREQGQDKLARDTIQKALNVDSQKPFTQLTAARFYWNLAELDSCIEHYRAAIRCGADNQQVWADLATALDASGRSAEARETFRTAFNKNPANKSVARQLAAMLKSAGKNDEALDVLAQAAQKGANIPEMYIKWGKTAASMWRIKDAMQAYRQAVENDGVEALTGLASLHVRRREFPEARDLLNQVIEEQPDFGPAFILQAEMLMEEERYQRAATILQEALDVANDDVRTRILLSEVYSHLGEHDKAINQAQVAVAAETTPATYAILALAFTARGKYDKAESALEMGRDHADNPDKYPRLLYATGRLRAAQNEGKKALEAFDKSLAFDPYQPDILIHAGEIHKNMKQNDECARRWIRATELDRWNPELEWRLAELLRNDLDRPDQAIPHYERHAELDGQHADKARQMIQQLERKNTD